MISDFYLDFFLSFVYRLQTEMQAHLGLCVTTSLMTQTSKIHIHILKHSTQTCNHINFSSTWPLVNCCTALFVPHSLARGSWAPTISGFFSLHLLSSNIQNHIQRKTHIHRIHSFVIFSASKEHSVASHYLSVSPWLSINFKCLFCHLLRLCFFKHEENIHFLWCYIQTYFVLTKRFSHYKKKWKDSTVFIFS